MTELFYALEMSVPKKNLGMYWIRSASISEIIIEKKKAKNIKDVGAIVLFILYKTCFVSFQVYCYNI